MIDVPAALATILEGAGLSLTSSSNLFTCPMPEVDDDAPAKCVAIVQTGGAPPEAFIGGGRKALHQVTCQVRVRSNREKFAEGQTLAIGVLEALNQRVPSGIISVEVRESAPFYGGTDESDRHGWSLNVVVAFTQTPTS